jgi:hypothetical protein
MTNSLDDLWTDLVRPASFPISITRLTSKKFEKKRRTLTFALEVIDVVLCNDHVAVLRPIILVYLHHLARHHYDLGGG